MQMRAHTRAFVRVSLVSLVALGILVGAGSGTAALAQSHDSLSEAVPEYRLLRQEEDWSALRGRSKGPALKAMSLSTGGPYLTVGGEVRAYARWYRHQRWGGGPERDGYLLQRIMLHGSAETRVSTALHVRGFAQLKSGLVADRDGPVYPPDRDRLGVNQAFLELGTAGSERAWTLRVGRQELHYGAGRMIAAREGPNVRLGFDAVWGRYRSDAWRVDAFVGRPTETPPGVLDNGWMPGRTLWGVYLRRGGWDGPVFSAYYLGTERSPSPADRLLRATRHTIGARVDGTAGRLGYDLEGAMQGGRYEHRTAPAEDGAVRAWMLAGRLAYRFSDGRGQPTLGIQADLSSGDRSDTAANETFVASYPSGRYTGAGSRLGPGNLINVRPVLGVQFGNGLHLRLTGYAFWRMRTTDAVYAIWGAPLRTASNTNARFVGAMPEGMLTWTTGRHLRLALEGSHFLPGPVLRESGPGRGLTHVGLRAKYVF